MFQGGFVGQTCRVLGTPHDATAPVELALVFPEDVSDPQTFPINADNVQVASVRLVFEASSDFFGRITVYTVDVVGTAGSAPVETAQG